jgi:hypothetical protein
MMEQDGQGRAGRRSGLLYASVAVALYAAACLVLFVQIQHVTGGHVLFALDDPYIHLALSEQIAAGHYGINPGEAASPASSVVWPFLLAVFARFSWQPLAALGLNFLAGLAAAGMMGFAVAAWPGQDGSRGERGRRMLSVVGLLLIGNLVGLTFIGMEHTLQVMLAVVCALGLTQALRGRPLPWWAMVAAAVAPMVRYECLTLTLAVVVCLAAERRWRLAGGVVLAAVAPLVAFSAFLRHLGLPLLPVSVLFKGGIAMGGGSAKARLLQMITTRIQLLTNWPERLTLLLLCAMLLELGLGQRERVRRSTLLGASAAGLVHLLVGPFGWFHRYEIYIVLFCALLVLAMLAERPRMLLGIYAALLLACGYPALATTAQIVPAVQDVYLQQYQMHRFMTGFATGNVAVNDLGLVSYHRRPGQTVLDLVGLGSVEVARTPNKNAAWLDAVTREHDVRVVMIYRWPWLFPQVPAGWTPLGTLCTRGLVVSVGDPCVHYYTTGGADTERLQSAFKAFTATLPARVDVKPGE